MFQLELVGQRYLRYCVTVLWGAVSFGCGSHDLEETPRDIRQQIVNGQPSPASQNAIVAIYLDEATWGTGTVVAPNLVLTSKQLLFEPLDPSGIVTCNLESEGTPVGHVRDPEDFLVLFGEKFPMKATARGTRIFAGSDLDICRSDMALLEIDSEFPIDPVPLRLDAPPTDHERGLVIGWGYSDARLKSPPGAYPSLTGKRNQIDLEIQKVGPAEFAPPDGGGVIAVTEDTFVTSASGCYADIGAPFLSEKSGALVGTLTTIEPADLTAELTWDVTDCYGSHATFRSLAPEREWLLDAFREAETAAWFEGRAQPASTGEGCEVDEECKSGRCIGTASGGFCSTRCHHTPCAAEQQCLSLDGEFWCVPERIEDSPRSTSSCSLSPAPGPGQSSMLFSFLALGFAVRRIRRRVPAVAGCLLFAVVCLPQCVEDAAEVSAAAGAGGESPQPSRREPAEGGAGAESFGDTLICGKRTIISECDPLDTGACPSNEVCDRVVEFGGFKCTDRQKPAGAGEPCDDETVFCGPGLFCEIALLGVCQHYCCESSDCEQGECYDGFHEDGEATIGRCFDEYGGLCAFAIPGEEPEECLGGSGAGGSAP
jgi:MYXO-CTERM domain-containing protein